MEFERKTPCDNNKEGTTAVSTANESYLTENGSRNSNSDKESPSFTLKLISWNICGLDNENLKPRTEAICKIIEAEQADIVCLQEVVPLTAGYITESLSNYHCCFASQDQQNQQNEEEENMENGENMRDERILKRGYFVGTLLRKSSVSFIDDEVIDFPLSKMSRNLLKVNVTYKDLPICLLNSHLETMLENSETRKNQLETVFQNMVDAPENKTVIFGGDTSLREKELIDLGGLPPGIEDAWVTCGSQKRSAFTFDVSENDNLQVNWKFKAGSRYDRVFVRRCSPSKLKPISFELVGRERLSPYGCFPSDHWGILCHFERDNFKFKLDKGFSENNDEVQILQPYWMRKPKV